MGKEEHDSKGTPEDALFTALYLAAEQTGLRHELSYDAELGLKQLSAWLDSHEGVSSNPRSRWSAARWLGHSGQNIKRRASRYRVPIRNQKQPISVDEPADQSQPSSAQVIDLQSHLNARHLTVAEAAVMLKVSKMTVYRMVHAGQLETVRVGYSFRISEQAVRKALVKCGA
jgi:excisionase family DNA binding protein